MKGLHGDLTTMPLKDLIVYLGNRKASGNLTLEHAGAKKMVTLREGQVVNASGNRPREFLGQFLINMGQLSEDQFAKAYQAQQTTQTMLGQILVKDGTVPEAAVINALNLKFRETLLSALHWTEGNFEFKPEPKESLEGLDIFVDLLDIAREGEFRDTAWQAIRAVFPNGRVTLKIKRENLAETPKPGSLDEKLLTLVDEGASIDDMVLALHATDFFLYQRLYALYRLEALEVGAERAMPTDENITVPGGIPSVLGSEISADEVFNHAQAFFEQGNLEVAATLARRAYELNPGGPSAGFLRQVEAALTQQLKAELTEGGQIPTLKVPSGQLKTMALAAPERYLLSRVDGQRSVRSIVQVSPIHELDALRYFKGFVETGLVTLGAAGGDFI